MIKKTGYVLFAFFFYLFRLLPINRQKVFFVATHDDSKEGNIGIVADAIKKSVSIHENGVSDKKRRHTKTIFVFLWKSVSYGNGNGDFSR